jgi:hypothetical protein
VESEVIELSSGWAGTDETVAWMMKLVRAGMRDPRVVLIARNLVRFLPERDTDAEIEAISKYVRTKIRYTREGMETLASPRFITDQICRYGRAVGDCDEFTVLWATLHRILAHRVRLRVVSQRADKIAGHVFGEVLSPTKGWIADDTIAKRFPLGWRVTKNVTEDREYNLLEGIGGMNPRSLTITRAGNQAVIRENFGSRPGLGQACFAAALPALIGAAATLASTGANIALQMKAQKAQAQAEKKARKEAAAEAQRCREVQAAAIQATAKPVSASFNLSGGGLLPWLAVGGVAILGLGLYAMRSR